MQTGEDIQGLRKILDMTRLISFVLLVIHFYICCYPAFHDWHWTAALTDRVIGQITRTGLFSNNWKPKLAALLFLVMTLIGANGKKDEKIRGDTIALSIGLGLLFYFGGVCSFDLQAEPAVIAVAYMGSTGLGYLLILTGGGRLSRLLKVVLNKDIFNTDN